MAIVKNNVGVRDQRLDGGFSPSSGDDVLSGGEGARTGSDSSESDGSEDVSEVDSGMESDDLDYTGLGEAGSEFCQIGNQNCLIPYELYDLPDLTQILSVDIWNNCLAEEERFGLAEYLPDMDQETFMQTLRELLAGNNFHFGSPMMQIFEQLKGGLCEPRVVLYRMGLNFLQKREHYHRVSEYHNSIVGSLVQIRDVWENCAGYGVEERLRVLNIQRSRRKLGYNEHNKVGSKVELEADESFMARWNRRLRNVSRLHYSSDSPLPAIADRSHLHEEPSKYWKEQPKGTLKVAGLKAPLKKGRTGSTAKIGHAMGSNNRGTTPTLGVSHLDQSVAFDYGGNAGLQDKLRDYYGYEFDDTNADEEDYEVDDFRTKAKHGKKHQHLKRRREHSFPVNYGDEETQDYSGLSLLSRKKDADQILTASYNDPHVLKKSRHLDIDRIGSVKDNPDHLALKGEWADSSTGHLHSRRGNIQKEAFSVGHPDRYSERSSRKKQLDAEDLKVNSQKSVSHLYSDHMIQSLAWNVRRKSSKNVGRDAEYVSVQSSFFENEETDSDSSEQLGEENIVSTHLKKIKHSNAVTDKHRNAMYGSLRDPNDAKKVVKRNLKNGGALSLMPEKEPYQSKGQARINSYAHGHATKTSSPVSQKHMFEMEEETEENHYVGRPELSLVKNQSAERMRKGPDLELPLPNMHEYLSGSLMEDADGIPDAIASQAGGNMSGNSKAEFDSNGQLYMPLSGCKSLATKRKLDKSRHRQGSSDKLADLIISKKNVKKKTEEGLPAMTPDCVSQEKEAVAEPELKPSRKPFTLITPTVHTGFSFSIVHLLSAVRKAMITASAEDTSEIGNIDGRKDNSDANYFEGHKGMPSLTVQEIVSRVKSNPGDPCILETQEPLHDLVRGVLKIFSSKTSPLGAKAWKPLVMYEKSTKSWSWIGPVSPSTSDPVEEETSAEAWGIPHKMLVKLVDAFANWLKSSQETLRKIGSLPPPPVIILPSLDEKERFKELRAQKSLNTIGASPDEVRAYFRQEELLRYQVPERAFSYTAADGKKSIVAPLRRGGGKPTSKARDHFMLKPDRPPHVTILCLVRDAAARLPGSIGTRADVCTLIRDSQYIVEDVSDNQVNQVVSGALDRLHYERDPCVQYDSERKLWVYLHRDREEEDFEDDGTSSTKKWKRPRKEATENADAGLATNANYPFNGDQDAGGTSVYEFNSDPNIAPSSTQMVEKPELVYSDLRPTDENVEPLNNSIQGGSHQGQRMPWDVLGMNSVPHGNQMLCQQNCTNEDFDDESFGRGRPVGLLNASLL